MTNRETYSDPDTGEERCEFCTELVDDCTCTCWVCGDGLGECACGEDGEGE